MPKGHGGNAAGRDRRRLVHDEHAKSMAALHNTCPTCGAEPGKPCKSLDGSPHVTRMKTDA